MRLFRISRLSPSLIVSCVALFAALGGSSYAASTMMSSNGHSRGGHAITSGGARFIGLGRSVILGTAGHFTFYAKCSADANGAQSVTFGVMANDTADLDGNGPMPAGTQVTIHTDGDASDSTPQAMLSPGQFAQVASASSSTEIANDGQEADVFYTDGVNWGGTGGVPYHACFAGYTGILARSHGMSSLAGGANSPGNSGMPVIVGKHF
jgi:hypothetical protein